LNRFIRSKWTSVNKVNGWYHFEVRNVEKKDNTLELFAVCDKEIIIKVSFNELNDKSKWIRGWQEVV
tara:strand:+ start:105 stop:305 length:201 start_codon:yes stop_codon:yes gene_type:complete